MNKFKVGDRIYRFYDDSKDLKQSFGYISQVSYYNYHVKFDDKIFSIMFNTKYIDKHYHFLIPKEVQELEIYKTFNNIKDVGE